MYLSKLDIFGFKSFAHKVAFQFDDGITAIIGPNGCGKSNIVDAIRWVLGEQRTSLLRLDRLENIIFNGTAVRKPLNMVEVSIHIENTKNILPSIYTEVKITRRYYRSGDSEYLINGRQVRLKDVIDLFTDTGMGSDAYSVIELKMVEQILSDNADERRRLFEEAAGIKKYKLHRKSALRKLETVEQELIRLSDILAEVQKTVNSLSRQVGKARRYHQFKNELKIKGIFLYQLKSKRYNQDLIPLRQEYEQVLETRERVGKQINQGEVELEKLQVKAVDLETEFREISSRLNKRDENVREIQQKVQLGEQKIETYKRNIVERKNEINILNTRLEELNQQKIQSEADKVVTENEVQKNEKYYNQKLMDFQKAEKRLEELRSKYQQFREENIEVFDGYALQRDNIQKIQIEKNSLQNQRERLEKLGKENKNHIEEKRSSLIQYEKDMKDSQKKYNTAEKEIELLQEKLNLLAEQIQMLENDRNVLFGEIEKTRSQSDFLQNLINNYEGFSQGVQYIMSQKQNYNGLIDTIANMVDTDEQYRLALESYLEEVANYLIVEEIDTAKNILTKIYSQKKGRLTLVPLSLLNNNQDGKNVPGKLDDNMIPLKDLVRYDTQYDKLFDVLLNHVYLVENVDLAIQGYKKYPQYKFLTYNGEFVGEWGKITGGDYNKNLNLTGRKQQHKEVSQKLDEFEKRLSKIEETLSSKILEQDTKKQKLGELQSKLKELEQDVKIREQQYIQLKYEVTRLEDQKIEYNEELEKLTREYENLLKQESHVTPEIKDFELKKKAYGEEELQLNSEMDTADNNYRELSHEIQQIQVDFLSKKNNLNELNQKLEFLENTFIETKDRSEKNNTEVAYYQEEIKKTEAEISTHKSDLDILYKGRDEVEKEKIRIESNYQGLKSHILTKEEELKKQHRHWNQSLERLKELELQIQEIEIRQKSQKEQFEEKFGSALENLLAENPIPAEIDLQLVQEEMEFLKNKIELLGEVNPLAIKEYEKEKERLDFLKKQQNDLLSAKSELLETIYKLNKTASDLFEKTFNKINDNFKGVFGKFFEGGEAELFLVENNDPLDANIDISVKIKGRKLSTLNLMSAGEKTLTAISLLFAIYLYKPSPFCILDEVDAPLDDVNISRYTHALQQFASNTQFILVTHNKRTMQAAEAMYGITMEEPGVSKVVSVRFD